MENRNTQLENNLAMVTTENERLRNQIKEKEKEIELGRVKYSNLEQSQNEYLNNIKEQYEHMLRSQTVILNKNNRTEVKNKNYF